LLVAFLGLALIYTIFYCRYRGGSEQCRACMAERERKRVAALELADDMDYVKSKLAALVEYTGLPPDKEEEDRKISGIDDDGDA
jgi:hypothetical protein